MASRSGIDHQEKAAFPSSAHSFNKVGNVKYARPTPGALGSEQRERERVVMSCWGKRRGDLPGPAGQASVTRDSPRAWPGRWQFWMGAGGGLCP